MVYKFIGFVKEPIAVFYLLLLAAVASGSSHETFALLEELKSRVKTEKNDSAQYELLIKISEIYMRSDLPEAVQHARKARTAALLSGSMKLLQESYYHVGKVYFEFGLMDSASFYFSNYLEQVRENGTSLQRAVAFNSIGAVLLKLSDYSQAEKYLQLSLSELNQLEQNENSLPGINKAYLYNNLGLIAKERNEFQKAVRYYQSGLRIVEKSDQQESIKAKLYSNLGNAYFLMNDYDSSLFSYSRALILRSSAGDKTGMAASYRNIGLYYDMIQQRDSGIYYMRKAFETAVEVNSYTQMRYSAEYLYEMFDKARKPDSALKYLKLAGEMKSREREEIAVKEMVKREMLDDFRQKERDTAFRQMAERIAYPASILLTLAALSVLMYRYRRIRQKLLNEQEESAKLSQTTEIIQNEKEKISKEYDKANRKLTVNSLKSMQKDNMINQLAERLMNIRENGDGQHSAEIGRIIHSLDKAKEKLVWKEFEFHFLQIHPGFYEKVNQINPKLSPNDRRLCAFLKMGLSTKEISEISGRTIDSINKSRLRLRQKLKINNNSIRITEFLNTLN